MVEGEGEEEEEVKRERVGEDDELAYYVTCKMTWHKCRTCGQI